MQLCIFEDHHYTNFFPLVHFRPVFDLRCGALALGERIERMLPRSRVSYICRPLVAEILREAHPQISINAPKEEPTWFVNGRLLAHAGFLKMLKSTPGRPTKYFHQDSIVAAWVDSEFIRNRRDGVTDDVISGTLFSDLPGKEVDASLVRYPWDLVHLNGEALTNDFSQLTKNAQKKIQGKLHAGAHLLNRGNIILGKGSVVKPGAVLDASDGPIIIGEKVMVCANAVIEGPAYIGRGTIIKAGAKIHGSSTIGEVCKVGGEIEASIVHSHSNKQHDGYLGHSYLGSWVNIGADTNTSDLKNTYGSVAVTLNGERFDTGQQFVGMFMGDHSKTGINVMFDTGSIIGTACNVYGAGLPPKYLPSFSWGNAGGHFTTHRLEQALETARRVMERRNVQLTRAYERLFRSVFEQSALDRTTAGII